MALIRPRLTDHFGIALSQADIDFAIPFLDEDVPLYVDPFMLWRSPSQQDNALHTNLISAFNHLGSLVADNKEDLASEILITASECDEVGLGTSKSRRGKRIGKATALEILNLFKHIPQYSRSGFRHFEEIQLFIEGISKDRISDITCSFLKSFLIDFTIQQCEKLGIPKSPVDIENVYNFRKNIFEVSKGVLLPCNPIDGSPLIFVPKRWLRYVPWLSFDDYFLNYCPQDEVSHTPEELTLDFTRFDRHIIMSQLKRRKLHEGYQIYSRI